MDVYLISRVPRDTTAHFVSQIVTSGSFLGPQYKATVRYTVQGGLFDTVITYARNAHNPMPELLAQDETATYVFSGYLVDMEDPQQARRYFGSTSSDARPIARSPGGIYSYATVRQADGQVSAGHSTPTLEPVYYGLDDSSLHVSNHPLLLSAAMNGFERPLIDERFYLSAVNAGVAIDDTTPFLGCYRLPPRSVLVGRATSPGVTIRSAPLPDHGGRRVATSQQRLRSVRSALIEAGSILERLPKGELRVSGGKDSRLVAAYLKHAGIDVIPVNQNFPEEVEGQVADRVAQVLGAPHCVRLPIADMSTFDAIEVGTRRKIAFAAGLPPVAALQYPTASEGSVPGIPLIMGHAHLQRGGLNRRIRTVAQAYEVAMSRTVSPFLLPAYNEPNRRMVRRFVDEMLARPGVVAQGISFHAYLQYSMNYQFQSLYTYVRNWNPLITPMLDERFALLCEDIADAPAPRRPHQHAGITDMWNEHIAMGVIETLAPSMLEFPLSGDRFRSDVVHHNGHHLRDPDLIQPNPIPQESLRLVFNTRHLRASLRASMWERIEGTPVARLGEMTTRPEIWRYVSEPDSAAPETENTTILNQFVWMLYGLSLILGVDWWSELSIPPPAP